MKQLDWKNPSTWPTDLPDFEIEPDDPRLAFWADLFVAQYSEVIAYHACRPVTIEDYYKEGLKPSNHEQLINQAIDIFCSDNYQIIRDEHVKWAAMHTPYIDDGSVYFCLDDRIYSYASQYFIGSEYISSIAVHLANRFNICIEGLRCEMLKVGIPTIFKVTIPVQMLSRSDMFGLVQKLADYRFDNCEGELTHIALRLRQTLPAQFIVSHCRPIP